LLIIKAERGLESKEKRGFRRKLTQKLMKVEKREIDKLSGEIGKMI